MLNGLQARKYRHELSNSHRWWIWYQWLDGKLKPRRTAKALEYVEAWDRQPWPGPDLIMQSKEEERAEVFTVSAKKQRARKPQEKKGVRGKAKRRTRK